jgi:hemoglobin-like flavoprotein
LAVQDGIQRQKRIRPGFQRKNTMTSHQIDLVRASHALVAPIGPQVAAVFYDRLFTADPALRRFFKGDIDIQGERLLAMIGAAVHLLDRPDSLLPALRVLGVRHAGCGVRAAHYATIAGVWLDTLAAALGPAFSAEVRAAWSAMVDMVSCAMIEAAEESTSLAA